MQAWHRVCLLQGWTWGRSSGKCRAFLGHNDRVDITFVEAFNISVVGNRSSESASVYNRSHRLILYLLAACAGYDTEGCFKRINVGEWYLRRKHDTL